MQCSQNKIQIRRDPDQDKAINEDERMKDVDVTDLTDGSSCTLTKNWHIFYCIV